MGIRFDVWRIGGSHAQRDIVAWTLTEAAIRTQDELAAPRYLSPLSAKQLAYWN